MYKFFKRVLDVFVSFIALIILIPVFIPIIIVLRFSGEGEVFYFQERYGINNSKFKIFKFATMLKNSINIGRKHYTWNDSRVTKVGSLLRKLKLMNFLKLLIFWKTILVYYPRPLVEKTFKAYSKEVQSIIYNVKPGLTGIGSIVFRDEESIISAIKDEDPHEFYKRIIAPYKGKLELWYQKNSSFFLDLKLIFLTAWVILFQNQNFIKWFTDLPYVNFRLIF